MEKINFSIIGSGWRSLFYIRLAKALPELFALPSVLVRTEEKRKLFSNIYGVKTFIKEEDILALAPEFVVVAVNKADLFKVSKHYLELGIPVFVETPLVIDKNSYDEASAYIKKLTVPLAVAEQYFLIPYYSAMLKSLEYIGKRESLYISLCHAYHAVSLIRKIFPDSGSLELLYKGEHEDDIYKTYDRWNKYFNGEVKKVKTTNAVLKTECGNTVLFDFCSENYHSSLRKNLVKVEGSKGVVVNDFVSYVGFSANMAFDFKEVERNDPDLNQQRVKVINKISLGDEVLFENKYPGAVLSEDEYAIALMLENFHNYIQNKEKLFISPSEALKCALDGFLLG